MIKTEQYTINGVSFVRTYSDSGRYVVRDGEEYEEACDPAEFGRTYVEGRIIPIEEPEYDEYAEAGKILMGVEQ